MQEVISCKVNQLNLSRALKRTKESNDWDEDRLSKAEKSYRRYLILMGLSERSICPSPDVDEVWHNHILHTKMYVDDCNDIFGKYIHHLPFPKVDGPIPKPHRMMMEYTIAQYEAFFGKEAVSEAGYAIDNAKCKTRCLTGCQKGSCRSDCCQGDGC